MTPESDPSSAPAAVLTLGRRRQDRRVGSDPKKNELRRSGNERRKLVKDDRLVGAPQGAQSTAQVVASPKPPTREQEREFDDAILQTSTPATQGTVTEAEIETLIETKLRQFLSDNVTIKQGAGFLAKAVFEQLTARNLIPHPDTSNTQGQEKKP